MMISSVFRNSLTRNIVFARSPAVTPAVLWRVFSTSTSTNSNNSNNIRPFRILGIQQIAIGCEDREPLTNLWGGIFGILQPQNNTRVRIESENVEEDILSVGRYPYHVEIDLMTPIDVNSSPKVHKPPLNHIGLWVDHLEQAVQWMETEGVRFTPGGIRKGAAGYNVAFIHPKGSKEKPISGNGVLIELVQAPDDVINGFTTKEQGK